MYPGLKSSACYCWIFKVLFQYLDGDINLPAWRDVSRGKQEECVLNHSNEMIEIKELNKIEKVD